jgi:hypothetical protein
MHRNEIAELKRIHSEEIAELKSKHREEISALEQKLAKLQNYKVISEPVEYP